MLLMFCGFGGLSQILNSRVSIRVQDAPVKNVLIELERQIQGHFSYTEQTLGHDQRVSLSCDHERLSVVLYKIFGTEYKFKEHRNYIIISKERKADKEIILKGYITNRSGLPVKNVTVYESKSMRSVSTDTSGYYELRVKRELHPESIMIRKQDYADTAIRITVDHSTLSKITLDDADSSSVPFYHIPALAREADRFAQTVSSVWIRTAAERTNVSDTLIKKFQIGIVPYVGSNRKLSANAINKVSFNLLGGYSFANESLDMAGLFNVNKTYMKGAQFAGLFNLNGTTFTGAQFSGLFNMNGDSAFGAQFAGLFNYNHTSAKGARFAGLLNLTRGESKGASFAGLANISTGSYDHLSVAGFGNFARKAALQIAPFNFALETGAQAGVFNFAKTVKTQVGVFNFADSVAKASVGLFSFIRKGLHQVEIGYDSDAHIQFHFRSGTNAFYSILASSIRPGQRDSTEWSFGYGIGTAPKIFPKTHLVLDLSSHQMVEGGRLESFHQNNKLHFGLEYRFTRHIAVFVASSLNYSLREKEEIYLPYASNREILYSRDYGQILGEMWVGWKAGIRLL